MGFKLWPVDQDSVARRTLKDESGWTLKMIKKVGSSENMARGIDWLAGWPAH